VITPRKFRVVQRNLFFGVCLGALGFAFIFKPLSRNAAAQDERLTSLWQQLNTAGVAAAADTGVGLAELDAQGRQFDGLAARLKTAGTSLTNRLELDAPIYEKIRLPFQLFEFQNERQLQIEKIGKLAREKNVLMAPATFLGFPDYSSEQKQPGLLWGHLALVQYALEAGLQCQLASINTLASSLPRPIASEEIQPAAADELSITMEVTGTSPAITRFLLCLALKPDEAKAMGLPVVSGNKPALFVDRILMRKHTLEKPDSVKLDLRITALVFRN
jgi:hypothetical protein